jgi:TetR/AcrR family transcriptional regulator, ethionamide resistance regulator
MSSITRKHRSARANRRELMRRELLSVVERLLEEGDSYTSLSVERLVAEAGISRSTFYVYFQDKGELLRALLEDLTDELMKAARQWWDLAPATASREDVRTALRGFAETYRRHGRLFAAAAEVAAYDPQLGPFFGRFVDTAAAELVVHIRGGQLHGGVDASLDAVRTAAWLTWMAERGLYQLLASAPKDEAQRLADALADIVWNTLYAAPARPAEVSRRRPSRQTHRVSHP